MISIGNNLTHPIDGDIGINLERLIVSRLLIQAASGGGKSWLIRRILEQSHGQIQHIVIDVEGEFYTLREKYDYILASAGDDGDCPANPRVAKQLALDILRLGVSAIVDIYELEVEERAAFVGTFVGALINAPRELWHPAMIVVDEANTFAPQGQKTDASRSIVSLMTKGRKRGFCGVLATQRISALDKNASGEALNKLIGHTSQDVDRIRAADELAFHRNERLLLRKLAPGQFYAFGPAISDDVLKVSVGSVATTHPKPGMGAPPVPPPRETIQAVLSGLHDVQSEPDDESIDDDYVARPSHRIAELEDEVASLRTEAAASFERGKRVMDGALCAAVELNVAVITGALNDLCGALSGPQPIFRETQIRQINAIPREKPTGLTPTATKQLAAITGFPAGCGHRRVGLLTGYRLTSSGFAKGIRLLRERGLITGNGLLKATDAGKQHPAAQKIALPAPGRERREFWKSKLTQAEATILDTLAGFPDGVAHEDLTTGAGYSTTSSGPAKAVRQLVALELASVGPNGVRISPDLV